MAETDGAGGRRRGRARRSSQTPAAAAATRSPQPERQGRYGPDLDEALQGKDDLFIYNSIVNPDAEVAEGFQPGLMPKTYGEQLDDKQLGDLVAFLKPKS